MNLGNALARLHQANRRAAAFEARCAQLLEELKAAKHKMARWEAALSLTDKLLEERVRLEAKVEEWRKIADGYARSASLEYRDKLEDEIRELEARLSQLLEENERLREDGRRGDALIDLLKDQLTESEAARTAEAADAAHGSLR